MTNAPTSLDQKELFFAVGRIVRDALLEERGFETELQKLKGPYLLSARNLIHNLAVRKMNLEEVEGRLTELGCASLLGSEAHLLATLQAVLQRLEPEAPEDERFVAPPTRRTQAKVMRKERASELLGGLNPKKKARLSICLPVEAAHEPRLAEELLRAGADILWIDCAEGDSSMWKSMLTMVRRAEKRLERKVKVAFDVAGPQLMTGQQADADAKILLSPGDPLLLTRPEKLGKPAKRKKDGEQRVARIPVNLPETFADLRAGERVWFDEGKVGGVIEQVSKNECLVRVRYALKHCARLRPARKIYLPDSKLSVPCLTKKDLRDLDFVAQHADIVVLSTMRSTGDIASFYAELAARDALHLGVLLSIETAQAFAELPSILLEALRFEKLGVVAARRELALDVGLGRLSCHHEDLLRFAAAAHLPVVEMARVHESLATTGMPSWDEVSSAVMSDQVDCVSLRHGPYLVDAVEFLRELLGSIWQQQLDARGRLEPFGFASPRADEVISESL